MSNPPRHARRIVNALFGAPPPESMPARVHTAIAEQQRQSELLIGIVQIGIVGFFALLYAASPKTFEMDVAFEPVPGFLAVYVVFTILRLFLACRNLLPGWFLALSVVVDMSLLIGLIWSFHLQYQQPLALFLKAPTMLYIFIFIALRALRFDSRFVILSGLVGAMGWIILVLLSIDEMRIGDTITRDFIEYMTSAKILVGAELDRIVSILVVTGVLALANVRARRFFFRSAMKGAAVDDLSRFFAPEIARQITGADAEATAGNGVLRSAAVLFCDVRGFTSLAKSYPPQQVIAILADYEALVVPIIEQHGGVIDKFLGDGIMATFGAVEPSERYAADALRSTQSIIAAAAIWNEQRAKQSQPVLEIGVAAAHGDIIFGIVGSHDRLEYTVIGDAVNLAAKLEKHNKTARTQAITTDAAYTLAGEQGFIADNPKRLPQSQVEGVTGAIDLVAL